VKWQRLFPNIQHWQFPPEINVYCGQLHNALYVLDGRWCKSTYVQMLCTSRLEQATIRNGKIARQREKKLTKATDTRPVVTQLWRNQNKPSCCWLSKNAL